MGWAFYPLSSARVSENPSGRGVSAVLLRTHTERPPRRRREHASRAVPGGRVPFLGNRPFTPLSASPWRYYRRRPGRTLEDAEVMGWIQVEP